MKYAHLEENTNKILGWYSDDIHLEIPTPNIEVTDEVWQEAININANCYENGKFIVKDFRTDEQKEEIRTAEINTQIAEAKGYLASTDFKMTVDYYPTMTTEQQEELTRKRAEARSFLREQGL